MGLFIYQYCGTPWTFLLPFLDTNDKGEIIENCIAENDLCLFNNKQPTYLHYPTRNYFALDLSICSPNIYLDFDWSVVDDLHRSDHFPIKIEEIESTNEHHENMPI